MKVRTYLHENKDLPVDVVKEFSISVRAFYEFPLDDPTLQNLGFIKPSSRQNVSGDAVLGLAMRFGCEVQEDQLLDEYLDCQLSPDAELPSFLPDNTSLYSFWSQMEEMRVISGNKRFQYLPLVAWAVLSLPHSNADPVRCFSMAKIQTDHRDNFSNSTLNSLSSWKINSYDECHNFKVSKDLREAAKKACLLYQQDNESVCSKS